jgi:hypothetical protein
MDNNTGNDCSYAQILRPSLHSFGNTVESPRERNLSSSLRRFPRVQAFEESMSGGSETPFNRMAISAIIDEALEIVRPKAASRHQGTKDSRMSCFHKKQ